MPNEMKGQKGGEARPNPKHFDEVRASKGAGEVTHPNNKKTMGGAERISEQTLNHTNEHNRIHVNAEPRDGAGTHADAMKAHSQAMESHRLHMASNNSGSPSKGRGLTEHGSDHSNQDYEMTHQGWGEHETNQMTG